DILHSMRRKKGKVPPDYLNKAELLQWATYMKSEDINLRTRGEQTLYSIWTDIFPDDRTPGVNSSQVLYPLYSQQFSTPNNSSVRPQFSSQPSQPSTSTSSIRPSRREIKFFEKIADNKMDNFCLNLWVKNVFSAVPKMQHYAHVYLILAWNEEYPTCIDHV
ncbi:6955_t:CDS:2, partial [Racocetra fulgida]